MISAVQWIPKGGVKRRPARMELSEAEAAMLRERYGATGAGSSAMGHPDWLPVLQTAPRVVRFLPAGGSRALLSMLLRTHAFNMYMMWYFFAA
jgi:hypothetical protein